MRSHLVGSPRKCWVDAVNKCLRTNARQARRMVKVYEWECLELSPGNDPLNLPKWHQFLVSIAVCGVDSCQGCFRSVREFVDHHIEMIGRESTRRS